MIASIPVSMRLVAEEHQNGTMSLLLASPVRDYQIIFGKFLGAFGFLTLLILVTFYMPLLIMIHGKVSWGHVLAGYLGTVLLGGASLAIGTFGSSLSRSQIIAVFVSAFLLMAMVLAWLLGRYADKPLDDIFAHLALHNIHYFSFKGGKIHLRDIVYYCSVIFFFLFAATRMLESRRWR
jgi:ABC-2 type transport system permease protein